MKVWQIIFFIFILHQQSNMGDCKEFKCARMFSKDCYIDITVSIDDPIFTAKSNVPNKVTYLKIHQESDVPVLTGEVCTNFPNLKTFAADFLSVEEIDGKTFLNCTNLIGIYLHENSLTKLPNFTLPALPNLKTLVFSDNQINYIHPKAFEGLTNLQNLFLGGNQLKNIDASVFQSLKKLKVLHLENNKLSSLDIDSILKYTQLNEIRIQDNDFECSWLTDAYQKLKAANVDVLVDKKECAGIFANIPHETEGDQIKIEQQGEIIKKLETVIENHENALQKLMKEIAILKELASHKETDPTSTSKI